MGSKHQFNVLNEDLELCSLNPLTGFTRNGFCETNQFDQGTHLICAQMTNAFLKYTKSQGNDLSTPRSYFPGLKQGDKWCNFFFISFLIFSNLNRETTKEYILILFLRCICVYRWIQAKNDGFAPPGIHF